MQKLQNEITPCGQSLWEILGVIAIVGILSIGAFLAYSKAMNRYKMNQTVKQISSIVSNLHTIFLTSKDYASLAETPTETAIKLGIFPEDMIVDEWHVRNLYGGSVTLSTIKVNNIEHGGFSLNYEGLPKDIAVFLGTTDWETANNGLIGIDINNQTEEKTTDTTEAEESVYLPKIFAPTQAVQTEVTQTTEM